MEKISYLVLSPQLVCTSVLLFVQMIVTLSLEWLWCSFIFVFLNYSTFTFLYSPLLELRGRLIKTLLQHSGSCKNTNGARMFQPL